MTITELLVTTVLMGFTMAAVGEMVILNTFASTKLTNSVDGQLGCSRAIRRIGEDVRRARVIGTVDGTNQFGGYLLNNQTLILQQPSLFQDPNDSGTNTNILDSLPLVPAAFDTVIYRLLQDPNNSRTWQLLISRTPGSTSVSNTKMLPALDSQVVLTGIIGPSDPKTGTNPFPFSYFYQGNGATGVPLGVAINLEVQTPPGGSGRNVQRVATHAESYLKSAINSRSSN